MTLRQLFSLLTAGRIAQLARDLGLHGHKTRAIQEKAIIFYCQSYGLTADDLGARFPDLGRWTKDPPR
jgi:hypothetical protein